MPACLMGLLQHELIKTILHFYVGNDAQHAVEAVRPAFVAIQERSTNSAGFGATNTALPEARWIQENKATNK